METQIIDTLSSLRKHLDALALEIQASPILYVDLEGNDLGRRGTLSLITILGGLKTSTAAVVDVKLLGRDAFATTCSSGQSLKGILESRDIVKVFFDVRNDSDALFSLFGISVQGIQDLQLMELALRRVPRRCVNGLTRCIQNDADPSVVDLQAWRKTKERGQKLFNPLHGGSFAIFDERPLDPEIKAYCIQDVMLMPHLRQTYRAKLCDAWWQKITDETEARIRLSQTPGFVGQGRHMAEGPSGWRHWSPTLAQKQERSFLQQGPSMEREVTSEGPLASCAAELKEANDNLQQLRLEQVASGDELDFANRLRSPVPSYSGFYDRYNGGSDGGSDDDGGDLAACDKECGYCGHCDY